MRPLTSADVARFHAEGFIRLDGVYTADEIAALSADLDHITQEFATWEAAWRGPWRKNYVDEETEQRIKLVALHELQHFSAAWTRALAHPPLVEALSTLLESEAVEFHHMTLHSKPPGAGAPFPMHQDHPFYPHADGRYLDTLVHLDDSDEERGCIRFLPGSHRLGALEHIMGPETSPHLPVDEYPLSNSVALPARAGDVVVFSIWTVHGSSVNRSGLWRRLVRMGYRHPENRQLSGQAMGRPGIMVRGVRPAGSGGPVDVYGNWRPPES